MGHQVLGFWVPSKTQPASRLTQRRLPVNSAWGLVSSPCPSDILLSWLPNCIAAFWIIIYKRVPYSSTLSHSVVFLLSFLLRGSQSQPQVIAFHSFGVEMHPVALYTKWNGSIFTYFLTFSHFLTTYFLTSRGWGVTILCFTDIVRRLFLCFEVLLTFNILQST